MTLHHATIAKAQKIGVILTEDAKTDRVQAHWAERNKRGYCANSAGAPKLVEDMAVLRLITLEYPQLKVVQSSLKGDDCTWSVSLRGDVIGTGARLQVAWDEAFDVLSGSEDDEGSEDDAVEGGDTVEDGEDGDGEGKSVIKRVYKTKYKPFKATNGDDLVALIARHVKVKDDETGETRVDVVKLRNFAKANGCWDDKYAHLNVGMQRLNIGNRLRAKVRHGHEIIWA